ncbi:MAG: hypothetical protein A2W85_13680 [Bacteroidetes bacterium GWF2_41_31]|nr:MAG: hypothetical protein A2W85_13680 [Bacteroidetes bacterium GWF2_41_31]OFZ08722.1 MAG: hypothetical protein A2338_02940 [Bacteroidetes bacterium RIFOXYB12_FULL_41_6]
MKSLVFLTLGILLLAYTQLFAQNTKDLYQPIEIRKAYANGTRGYDGKPGPDYFQNRADYVVNAEFFPKTNILTGFEIINYQNNSNDTLSNLYVNLYQNLYKKGVTRDEDINEIDIHDGVEITRVMVNETQVDLKKLRYFTTIMKVPLSQKLLPKSEMKIEIEWKVRMPFTLGKRQGTYDKTNFFIAYWYPKICVFDDIDGWNVVGHAGIAEFYNDFGNFDVEVTVPAEYNVWSTGVLQNADEIYTGKFIERINQASQSDSVIHIITETDRKEKHITKAGKKHSWRFKSENQADFAFGVSNSYLWDGASVIVEDKRIPVSSVYSPKSKYFKTVTEISRNCIGFFSTKIPAIPFPNTHLTAFQCCISGMEFPGMINDAEFNNPGETAFATTHEIGHSYFPFNVGVNEQKYGWMDEGTTLFVGLVALADLMGDTTLAILDENTRNYTHMASYQAVDVPIMLVSYDMGEDTHGFISYVKMATALNLLCHYMGKQKFYQAIREFTNRWKGKHPIPYDWFFTFNEVAGEDLAWFWKPWFFELGYADLAIGKIEKGTDSETVTIENLGGYPIPVILTVKYADGTKQVIKKKMDIWKAGIKSYSIEIPAGEIKALILNDESIPETKYENNTREF